MSVESGLTNMLESSHSVPGVLWAKLMSKWDPRDGISKFDLHNKLQTIDLITFGGDLERFCNEVFRIGTTLRESGDPTPNDVFAERPPPQEEMEKREAEPCGPEDPVVPQNGDGAESAGSAQQRGFRLSQWPPDDQGRQSQLPRRLGSASGRKSRLLSRPSRSSTKGPTTR